MSSLPTIRIGRKLYVIDARLQELRNVNNPHDTMTIWEAISKVKAQLHSLKFRQEIIADQITAYEQGMKILEVS